MSDFPVQNKDFGYVFNFTPKTGNAIWSLNLSYSSGSNSLFASPSGIQNISGESGISYSTALSTPYLLLGNPTEERVEVYKNNSLDTLSTTKSFYKINRLTGFGVSAPSGFGSSVVGVDGVGAVGAPYSTIGNFSGAGAVFVFDYILTGGLGSTGINDWGQVTRITGVERSGNYGQALAMIQSDTEPILAGGATGEGSGSGAMYLHNSISSALIKKLTPTGEDIESFGKSVAFAQVDSVKYVIVGYDYGGTGKIQVYKESSEGLNDYTESQKLSPASGKSGDKYAYVIDSNNAEFVVGSPEYGGSGRAFYYTFNEEQGLFEESQQIYPSDLGPDQQFGKSLAFDGVNGIITSNKDSGKGYIYYLNGNSWNNISTVSGDLNKVSGSFGGNMDGSHGTVFEGDVLLVGNASEEYSYYFSTSSSVQTEYTGVSFSGSGGKLFDGEGNFLYGYNSDNQTSISGGVFTGGYYTMFVNSVICNSKVSRNVGDGLTGSLNSWTMSGADQLSYFTMNLWN